MLAVGSSLKWPDILKQLTGTDKMDINPLLEYFKPLQDFLDKELEGVETGWTFDGMLLILTC